MSNAVTVVAPHDHVPRMQRIAQASQWIEVWVVARIADAPEGQPIVVIGDPERGLPDDPRVAYVARPAMSDDDLQQLLTAIAADAPLAPPALPSAPQTPEDARRDRLVFAASRKLAVATDLATTEATAVQVLCELLDVERAHCLFHDSDDGSLWSEARQRGEGDERRAIAGMIAWSVRTGLPCSAPIAAEDARYVAAIDDPDGDPASAVLVQPVLGADARVHAVFLASRRPRRAPLGPTEAAMLARFAALAAPLLDQLSIHVEGQQLLEAGTGEPLFRSEAVAAAGPAAWGEVVRVAPRWLSWAYWLLVLMLAGSIAFVALGTVSTYSTGPAVIRSLARTSVSARTSGNISSVEVSPGDRVAPGAVLARLDDVDQRAAVDRTEKELETQLRNHMLDPTDSAADTAVRTLRLQLEQARTALDERSIRATTAGVISDLRVRPGQHVEPGDIAASIVDGQGGLEVIALLPGEDRPQLAPGMPLRLELAGWRYAYQSLEVDTVSSDVIAPSEARRVLGAEVADSLHLAGPVVVVRGRLASAQFVVDDKTYTYHDGMLGTAEVPVRSEKIAVALVPALRRL